MLSLFSPPLFAQDNASRLSVTIYEMRSPLYEFPARAATDMFTTALVKTKKFRVFERQRINEGIARERDLNALGITTGDAASKKVKGASVIFEATISELTFGEESSETGVSIAGLQLGKSNSSDSLGIDVRVINASTSEVLDVINLRKKIESKTTGVSGIGALFDNVLASKGKSTNGLTPELSNRVTKKEGFDKALRELIEEAVNTLSNRSSEWVFD